LFVEILPTYLFPKVTVFGFLAKINCNSILQICTPLILLVRLVLISPLRFEGTKSSDGWVNLPVMSFTLATGGQGTVATAQVVWSFNNQTYNFRSDNNFLSWITTIFEVAEAVTGGLALTNPLVLPNNSNALGYSLNTSDIGDGAGGTINLTAQDFGYAGNIQMASFSDGNAGSINTSSGDSANGGSINTNSDEHNNGGSIYTFGGSNGVGGSINTSNGGGDISTYGSSGSIGGSINTSGGDDAGGSINTSDGGGSINTTGQGSIGLGNSIDTNQTLITGTATVNRTATFPDNSGTIALVIRLGVNITFGVCAGNGAVVASSQTVTGAVLGDAVLVTCSTNRTTLTAGGTSNIIFDGLVTGDNTVSVRAHNPHASSITLGILGFEIVVFKL